MCDDLFLCLSSRCSGEIMGDGLLVPSDCFQETEPGTKLQLATVRLLSQFKVLDILI
jgi:hypothetical protein